MPARWSLPSAEQFLRAELPQFIFNPKLPYPRDCYTYAIRLHVYSGTCPWDVEYVGRVLFSHFWMEGCCELIFYHSYTLAGLLRPALKSTRVLHPHDMLLRRQQDAKGLGRGFPYHETFRLVMG
jgi:hypothetical protein